MKLDYATIIGLFGSFAVITAAVLIGGSYTAFYNLPSVLIVLGGTFLVTTMSYSLFEVLRSQKLVMQTLFTARDKPLDVAYDMIELAERCRGKGILKLQDYVGAKDAESFQGKALQLVVDGLPADDVNKILNNELRAMTSRHNASAGILHRAAEVAPAMGLIGTLVGLVQMLSNLEDPSTIGPAMAVALLTTFYGAVLANMFFSPLASKLERNSAEEALINRIYIASATSIGRQENPRRLEMVLNTLLPPTERVQFYN